MPVQLTIPGTSVQIQSKVPLNPQLTSAIQKYANSSNPYARIPEEISSVTLVLNTPSDSKAYVYLKPLGAQPRVHEVLSNKAIKGWPGFGIHVLNSAKQALILIQGNYVAGRALGVSPEVIQQGDKGLFVDITDKIAAAHNAIAAAIPSGKHPYAEFFKDE